MGIVGIALNEPCLGGLPVDTQIDTMLVLYAAAFAETIGVERRVALVEITMNGGQPDLRSHNIAQRVDGRDGFIAVESGLSGKAHASVVVAIVEAEISEVAAFGGIETIGEVLTLGCQLAVHMGVQPIGIDVERAFPPSQAKAQVGFVGVVLLVHLAGRTVVAAGYQCAG